MVTYEDELTKKELDNLWKRFKEKGDASARQKLIIYYSPLAKYIAGRIASSLPKSVDVQDLVQNGILGLIDAIEKFNPEFNIKFETYAISRIKGAIIDSLRALDWLPRSLRFKAKELDKIYQELEAKLKRPPTEEELAEALEINVDQLRQLLSELSYSSVIALEETLKSSPSGDEESTMIDFVQDEQMSDPFESLENEEAKELLVKAVQELPEKERKVVILYYYSGLTLKEIGELLGVSESRASQIHSKAISMLRSMLKEFISS